MSVIEEPTSFMATTATTSSDTIFLNSTARNLITDKMDFIPQELQLPVVIVIGLLGFLAVLGLSKISARSDNISEGKKTTVPQSPAPTTPVKSRSTGTPLDQKTGTVMTPAGRRSARIARSRRKED